MTDRKNMLNMPKITNRDRVVKFCDWVDSIPLRLPFRSHPLFRAKSARLSKADWQAIDVELGRRSEAGEYAAAVVGSDRDARLLDLANWVADRPGQNPLADPEFIARFGDLTRSDVREATARFASKTRAAVEVGRSVGAERAASLRAKAESMLARNRGGKPEEPIT